MALIPIEETCNLMIYQEQEREMWVVMFSERKYNLLLLLKVNAVRHNLLLLLKVNAVRHNLLLMLKVNAARHKLTTAVESKENGVNILNSIDERAFQMGNFRETLAEGTEGALHLGPERPRAYSDLLPEDKERYNADIRATNILLQGLPKDIYSLINHYTDAKDIWDNVKMLLEGSELTKEDRESQLVDRIEDRGTMNGVQVQLVMGEHRTELGMLIHVKQGRQDVADASLGERVALDEEQLLFIACGQDNAIDEDVDEKPTMFMANLSSAYPVYDEAGSSYDSDILSEVHGHDHYQDAICEHHEEHKMHDDVQPNYVVDLHDNYTSDSNMILYDQYVKDNAVPVVQSNVSSIPNDAYMKIFNYMHELHAQSVSNTTQNTVVDNSLIAELATYKEKVELYEKWARFELTEREQKIDEQLRIVITDRNIKEENLKKELHSVKMQLASTINHNKSMVEEVTSLKKDFKQKENKYLEEFLDMKALKEKVEDKLYKQDQSLQTVHMLCKPKPYYNEQNKVAIGYKNPLCLTRAKQVQPALYNGYEIIKNNHVPALVHNTEDTLEIAEITRRKMNDKMKDPECVTHKVKIAPPDYSKENYLATFTPQKQLTPEQIFWSQDLIKMKEEALKKQTTTSRPIKALTVYPPNTPATLITRTKHIEQTTALLTENENLKAQIHENLKCDTMESVKPRVLALSSVETLCEIVEEAKVERSLDRSLAYACLYTKHSQELLEYVIGNCPKDFNQRDKKHAPTPLIRKKQVTFDEQCEKSNSNTHKHVEQLNTQKTNAYVPPSTRVNCCTNASRSQPRSNTKKNRISPAKGVNKKKVEERPRINKSNLRTTNRVDSSSSSKRTLINSNSDSVCQTCNKCLIFANHDVCVVNYLQSVKASPSIHTIHNVVRKVKQVWKPKQVRQVWKPTSRVLTSVGHQ
ncbi:hypothetical protein Tco_0492071 [Tanacetum coccineum]